MIPWRARWDALTREGRDTLWLLSVLTWVLAPHVQTVPVWASAGAALALAWRARLAWTDATLPSRPWMVLLLAASVVATWATHRTVMGREAGITLVVMLTTLKALELRARRDALVCLYLGFFLILTQFFTSQSLWTAAAMLVGVWGLLTSLVLGQRPLGRPPLREAGAQASRAMLHGLPLMVVLFVLFPRLGPLWSLPSDAVARTGLSSHIALGDVAGLAQDDSVALRITFDAAVPAPETLYFRGPTLEQFDGRTWRVSDAGPLAAPQNHSGPSQRFVLTSEPSPIDVLPLPQFSRDVRRLSGPDSARLRQDGPQWLWEDARQQRVQVAGVWQPRARLGMDTPPWRLRMLQQLPPGLNPATTEWARQRAGQHPEWQPRQRVSDLLRFIRAQSYQYTLTPPAPRQVATLHLIDDFWMDQRAGFCEHFASALVVVLRAQGVPARIVTGFQGAEYNPLDGQYVVRNSSAHAWVEYWQPGEGWLLADPTAAVDPSRVRQAPRRPLLPALPDALSDFSPDGLRQVRFFSEAVNHRWNTWVLQYSGTEQLSLLRWAGWREPRGTDQGALLAGALGVLGVVSTGWLWWQGRRAQGRGMGARGSAAPRRLHTLLLGLGCGTPPGPQPADASAWRRHLAGLTPLPGWGHAWHEMLAHLAEIDQERFGRKPGVTTRRERQKKLRAVSRSLERLVVLRLQQAQSAAHSAHAEIRSEKP